MGDLNNFNVNKLGNLSVGLKRFPSTLDDLASLKSSLDHLEIMALPNSNYALLESLDIPIKIHCPHIAQGFNPCNLSALEKNEDLLNFSLDLADKFDSGVVVVHPGHIVNAEDSEDFAVDFFNSKIDRRFRFENLQSKDGSFSDFDKFKSFLAKLKHKKICFDVGHAVLSSKYNGVNPLSHVSKFFSLEPDYFHLSGINLSLFKDHLNMSENNFDYSGLVPFFPRNKVITLETNHLTVKGELNTRVQIDDLGFVRKLF
ncbi:MAG: hypothetical protein ACLFN8_04705 [Candidatus Woesearchaeota archaeon]